MDVQKTLSCQLEIRKGINMKAIDKYLLSQILISMSNFIKASDSSADIKIGYLTAVNTMFEAVKDFEKLEQAKDICLN